MDKSAYQIRLQQWVKIIQDANASGMTKKDWCEQNGITLRVFYYWHKKARDYIMEQTHKKSDDSTSLTANQTVPVTPVFCEIPVPAKEPSGCAPMVMTRGFSPEAMVQVGRFGIFVTSSTSEKTLSTIFRAIDNA